MNAKKRFLIISMPIIMAICSLFFICDYVDAAPRTAVRSIPASRKSINATPSYTNQQTTAQPVEQKEEVTEPEPVTEPEIQINEIFVQDKSNQFKDIVSETLKSATSDNSFAEQIRKQRAALMASEATTNAKNTIKSGKNACDTALRECMIKTCGNDFTKCATDGDTIFGDKLNKCRLNTECSGKEFTLFSNEIKADMEANMKLSSYNAVLNCGNSYNACVLNECGTTFERCLGRTQETAAIEKCSVIAKECTEYDSGLTSRFSKAVSTLRQSAEKDIAKNEKRMYELRELMAKECTALGAMFDERTLDCVYTVNFYVGENQTTPMASRKRYAGETFICSQEWFGINATTYKENAYRETRAQTGASSAMLGSGVGTAAGLVTSGAIGRSLETQKARKELKEAKESQAAQSEDKPISPQKPLEEHQNENPPALEQGNKGIPQTGNEQVDKTSEKVKKANITAPANKPNINSNAGNRGLGQTGTNF